MMVLEEAALYNLDNWVILGPSSTSRINSLPMGCDLCGLIIKTINKSWLYFNLQSQLCQSPLLYHAGARQPALSCERVDLLGKT